MKFPLLPFCMILSLLAGCTASTPTTTQLQASEASPVPSDAPSDESASSGEALWWEHLNLNDLPSQSVDLTGDVPRDNLFLMDDMPDDDVSLYGYLSSGETPSGILLRRGSTFTHFDQDFLSESNPVSPQFWWLDPDGDGTQELAAYYVLENDGSVFRSEFHIYEVSEEGWSDHALLPDSCQQALQDALTARWAGDCLTLQLGERSSLSFDVLPDTVDQNAQLSCAQRIFYRYDRGAFTGVYAVGLEGTDGSYVELASLLADISYDGSNLTLTNLRLEGYYGV